MAGFGPIILIIHELGQKVSISRASEELFVTVLASGMMRMDALKAVHIGREVVIWIFVDTVTNKKSPRI